jgi:hypothetical protein
MRFLIVPIVSIALYGCGGGGGGGGASTSTNPSSNAAPTATPVNLVSLSLSASRSTIYVGDSFSVTATGTYSDGTTKGETLNYSSTPGDVVSASPPYFEALKPGRATITGRPYTSNSNVVGTLSIDVLESNLSSISFSGDVVKPGFGLLPQLLTQYVFNVGDTIKLIAEKQYQGGRVVRGNDEVVFTSSDPATASVETAGTINALKEGLVLITASKDSVSSSVSLQFVKPVDTPIVTINCNNSVPIEVSASTWNTERTNDPTNSTLWVTFSKSSCPIGTNWLLTSPTSFSSATVNLHLYRRTGITYRYNLPEATPGMTLDFGSYGIQYNKVGQILFK